MNYIEYDFTVTPIELGVEILVAELAEVGFESFVDTPTGVKAYIPKNLWREDVLEDVSLLENEEFTISYQVTDVCYGLHRVYYTSNNFTDRLLKSQ